MNYHGIKRTRLDDIVGTGKKIKDEMVLQVNEDNEAAILNETHYDVSPIEDIPYKSAVQVCAKAPLVDVDPLQVAQVQQPSNLLVRMRNEHDENLVVKLIQRLNGEVNVLPHALPFSD